MRFRIEELFLDSKSGAFELDHSRIRSAAALERLYLVAAVALLYGTTQGLAVQLKGWRRQVDPHWRRGLSYLKIGLRWLQGVLHKGRRLLNPVPLLPQVPQLCFAAPVVSRRRPPRKFGASKQAQRDYYDQIWFSRIHSLYCRT